MINPINNNNTDSGSSRAIQRTVPSEVATISTKRSASNIEGIQPQQDTAEISALAQSFEAYSKALGEVADVRPDVVANAREAVQSTIQYPPIAIVEGFVKLVGNELATGRLQLGKDPNQS